MTADVVIIGGGPAGCTAAIYAARAELKTIVVDRGITAGALGMSEMIENYPGLPRVKGAALIETMRRQAESFGASFIQDRVIGVDLQKKSKQVFTNTEILETKAVIIATGSMGRVSVVPGEEELVGRGVSYCATCDGAFYKNKTAAVVGDTGEAREEALFLDRFVKTLYFITRKEKLPGSFPDHVKTITKSTLQRIYGQDNVTAITVKKDHEEEKINVDGVFIYLQGNRPVTDFLQGALPTDSHGCLKVDQNMQTKIPGVFAAGDILCPEVKQGVAAAAEGCKAAMQSIRYLTQKNSLKRDWQ